MTPTTNSPPNETLECETGDAPELAEASAGTCEVHKTLEFYSDFADDEMCGRCLPCIRGTAQIVGILKRLIRGEGQEDDLLLLEALAAGVQETALCRRGRDAAGALADSLLKREEYEDHARARRCPARVCSSLVHYTIIPERCTMCGLCKAVCPQGAIYGEEYIPYLADNEPYTIKASRCDNCGLCVSVCEAGAIELV